MLRPFKSALKFARSYRAISREYLARNRLVIAGIIALSVVGAATQGGLIATVGYAVDYLQSPQPTGFGWADRLLANTWLTAGAICLLIGVLGILGSYASYQSRVWSRDLSRRVTMSLAGRCFSLVTTSQSAAHGELPGGSSGFRKLLSRDAKHLGKAIDIMLRALEASLRILMAVTVLTVINWKLTVSVPALLVLTIPLFYRMHTGVKRDADAFFTEHSASLGPVLREFSNAACAQNVLRGERPARGLAAAFERHPSVQLYFRSFMRILLARDRVKFATSTFSSLALGLALLLGATLVSIGLLTWGETLAYLLAFWVLMTSIKQLQGLLGRLAFFYPALLRMSTFLSWSSVEPDARREAPPEALEVLVAPALPGSERKGTVRFGEPLGLATALSPDRSSITELISRFRVLDGKGGRRRADFGDVCFLGKVSAFPMAPTVSELIAPRAPLGDALPGDFLDLAVSLGVAEEIRSVPIGPETVLSRDSWEGLSETLKTLLLVEAVHHDERPLALVEARWLHDLDAEHLRVLVDRLRNKLLVLTTARINTIVEACRWVAVLQGGVVIGFGDRDWGRTVAAQVSVKGESQADGVDADDEEDLDMLD